MLFLKFYLFSRGAAFNDVAGIDMSQIATLGSAIRWKFPQDETSFLRGNRYPNAGKPTIHFLHGNGLCGLTYWPLLQGLSKDYALTLHDCVGHGDSDAGEGFVSWEQSAQQVYEALCYQQDNGDIKGPLIGLGHSFGGVLTIKMAARYPHLFRCLVLMDPIIMPEAFIDMQGTMPNPLAEKTRTRRNHWSDSAEAFAYFRSKSTYKDWHDDSLNCFVEHALYQKEEGGLALKCPPAIEAAIFSSTPQHLWQDIRSLKVPTVILYGDASYPFMESACLQASENPFIKVDKRKGSHCFMLEYPDITCEVIQMYLQKYV